jgi:biotin carboxyl carrier protein
VDIRVCINGVEKTLSIEKKDDGFRLAIDGRQYSVSAEPLANGSLAFFVENRSYVAYLSEDGINTHLAIAGTNYRIEKPSADDDTRGGAGTAGHADGTVESPMPGNIIKVCVQEGDTVEAEQAVVVIESMKMQNEITSPVAGEVTKVSCAVGDQVSFGDVLVEVTPPQ